MSAKNSRLVRTGQSLRPSRTIWTVACIALALMLSMGNTLQALAAPGDLDPNFGTGGKVTTDFVGNPEYANAMAIQADGKVVAVGLASINGGDFAVARYNTNGTLDDNFAANGKVTTDFFSDVDIAHAVAIQANGKIVVGGEVVSNGNIYFGLARYNPDGSLDTSFSGNGKVYTDFGTDSGIFGLAIQSDGKIVAAGTVRQSDFTYDFAAARYNLDGSLDTSFSGNGRVIFDFGAGVSDVAYAVALQPNGRIVMAGFSGTGAQTDFAVARLTSAGNFDTSFSFDGKLTTDFFSSVDTAYGVALQSDGKIVVAGGVSNSTNYDFGLARYTSDGTLDTTFSGNGKTFTDFGTEDYAYGVAIQGNGKIVAAGAKYFGTGNGDFILARYNPNGSLDTSFSGNGMVTTDFAGHFDGANAVAIQANGKIVAAGGSDDASNSYFGLARYEGDTPVPPSATPYRYQGADAYSHTSSYAHEYAAAYAYSHTNSYAHEYLHSCFTYSHEYACAYQYAVAN